MQEHYTIAFLGQFIYGVIAIFGGAARYLNGYVNGAPFSATIFFASLFVAGFSGWVFSLIGQSMQLPSSVLYGMAGVGGFFGEQSMKFALEFFTPKQPK
jgi:hypothetical protein